ncbi:MAG: AAA family ATPase [Acidimicrobiia bacterium]
MVSNGVVHTPARRLRTLLAALLVEPRTPLSSESLIEAIWSGQRTADAAPTLRRHIARARTELGVPIAATPLGYRLQVEDDDIDGLRLAKAVRDARRDARHEGLRAALRLWRSTPYPELVDWAPGRLASAALAEARIEALELLVRADLDRAAPSAPLLGELRSIVDEHPYREVFWVLLVLALYRSGRQQEALDAVQAARARLAEDLGVLPGPELVAVERAVLDHAPDLRLPQADSPLLPPRLRLRPARAPLVGRTVPLQTLLDAWERVSTHGGGEVVLISGEAGIGKTRLASELAIVVTEGGGRVAYGQCEQHAVAPFEPLAGVLRDVLRTGGPPPPAPLRATLASMLPELATTPAEHRAAPSTSLLADAVATWLIAVASVRPMVLVVDDLHWLTPTGADLLRALTARVAAGSPILLLALARDEALPLPDSMSSPHATRIALASLDAAQTAQLGSHLGLDPARSLPEVMRSTGGVPLLLELLSEIGEEPATAVTRRVRELGQDAVTVLQVAALEPATFQLDIVADAAELDRATALRTLDRAVTARVIDELGIGLYRFRHAIVQDVVRDSTSATRRANLHLRLADATRVRTPHALDRLAHHLDLAGPQAAEAAITALVAAGSASAERGAAREALGFADRADRRIEASPQRAAFQTARLDSAIVRATALAQLGSPDWSRVALDAARVADHLGDVDRLVQAVLVTQRVLNTAGLRRTDPGRIELLQKALGRLEPANDPRHAMVITALADALRDSGEHLRMEELRRRVASIGDDVALPPRQRAQLLMRVSGVFDGQGGIPARLAAAAALTQLHNANPSDVAIRQMTAFTNVLVTATTADGSGLHFWLDVLALGIGEPEAPLAAWSVPLCRSWWALAKASSAPPGRSPATPVTPGGGSDSLTLTPSTQPKRSPSTTNADPISTPAMHGPAPAAKHVSAGEVPPMTSCSSPRRTPPQLVRCSTQASPSASPTRTTPPND